jgi:sec-independent protein translocase protein TatB
MFDVSPWEIMAIAVIALLVFGPDKLPKLAADAARLLREVRRMATGARRELSESLGPELNDLNLQDLNPATFVKRNLLDPIDDEVKSVKDDLTGLDVRKQGDADGGDDSKPELPTFDADTT